MPTSLDYGRALPGIIIAVGVIAGSIAAARFQAGIAGPTYVPTKLDRVVVMILGLCVLVEFSFILLKLPGYMLWAHQLAMILLETFFIVALATSIRDGIAHFQKASRAFRLRTAVFAILGVLFIPFAIRDIITRSMQLLH